ncbi:MAG TPA: hypothetical protein VIB48_25170 [Acidimicrobiia bacterium]
MNFFAGAVLLVLLLAVASMVRGDMRPAAYAVTLFAALVALLFGLWLVAGWLNP